MTEKFKPMYNNLFMDWIVSLDEDVKDATKKVEYDFLVKYKENARLRVDNDLEHLKNFFFSYQGEYIEEADKKAGFELIQEIVMKTISK